MARGRVRSRLELREQNDAAEARERETTKDKDDDDDDLGDLGGDATAVVDDEAEAPVTGKKKKVKKATEAKPRKKSTKVVRRRVVGVVFDNSNKKLAQFDYAKKAEAEAYAEKLRTEKKLTYFVQPVKEDIAAE
jgi:hypothetical protein